MRVLFYTAALLATLASQATAIKLETSSDYYDDDLYAQLRISDVMVPGPTQPQATQYQDGCDGSPFMLGSAPESVQATSLMTQHDSQDAFNELLQLDADTDAEKSKSKFKAFVGLPGKTDKLAMSIEHFVEHLAKLEQLYHFKYEHDYKGNAYGYCSDSLRLEKESIKVAKGINEKVREMRKALDALADAEQGIPTFKSLYTLQELKAAASLNNVATQEQTIRLKHKESLEIFKERISRDFQDDDGKLKVDADEDDYSKDNDRRKTTVAQLTEAVNNWSGLQSGKRTMTSDTRRYASTELWAADLITKSCENHGNEMQTTAQKVADVSLDMTKGLLTAVGNLLKIAVIKLLE